MCTWGSAVFSQFSASTVCILGIEVRLDQQAPLTAESSFKPCLFILICLSPPPHTPNVCVWCMYVWVTHLYAGELTHVVTYGGQRSTSGLSSVALPPSCEKGPLTETESHGLSWTDWPATPGSTYVWLLRAGIIGSCAHFSPGRF